LQHLNSKIENTATDLEEISRTTAKTESAVISVKAVALQLLQTVQNLPQQVQDALKPLLGCNFEIFTMIKEIHTVIVQSSSQPGDIICYVDVLGRSKNITHAYVQHPSVLSSLLQADVEDSRARIPQAIQLRTTLEKPAGIKNQLQERA
jgi:hypothetical protein